LVRRFQGSSGQARCDDCEPGKHVAEQGASYCLYCEKGYKSTAGQPLCTLCSKGYFWGVQDPKHDL